MALDTLASSSFIGSQDKHDLGVLLQRGIVVLSSLYAVVAVIWAASEHIFRVPGQEDYVAVEGAKFPRLLVPGAVGYVWWAFEIVALAAGRLGTIPLGAQSVIMTADQIVYTIPFGLGVATSARIGNLLRAQKTGGSARAAHRAAVLCVILGAVILTVLMSNKSVFGRIFNDDELLMQIICGGVLRGQGRQWVGALVNLISYYGGAGIYLALNGLGLKGLWTGLCVALHAVGFFEWVLVGLSNWNGAARKVLDRLDSRSSRGHGAPGPG
ncbi:hypothetical protein DL769_009117 [Monosporascus sp. CRB-8-3]|nr:hypothetical protein DL769_009117 [Monosporascus sp. CRB-8-3]